MISTISDRNPQGGTDVADFGGMNIPMTPLTPPTPEPDPEPEIREPDPEPEIEDPDRSAETDAPETRPQEG
jgi:hypothetical protein